MRSVVRGLFLPSWRFREYSFIEKVRLWRGKLSARRFDLWDTMLARDITAEVGDLRVPAYFLHGLYDYTCSYELARRYVAELEAPIKGFYTFEDSAHSPVFEEPERTIAIMVEDVLRGAVELADPSLR